METEHPEIDPDRLHSFDEEEVVVEDFAVDGRILDIGGGGEGLIGLLKGPQVVAIDSRREELEEADEGPLKIVMDATELKFLDGSFQAVTSFYTLMYIPEEEALAKVFREVSRVLSAGGKFLVWDALIPPREGSRKDVAVFPLLVRLPDQARRVAYGIYWLEGGRDLSCYLRLAEDAGFRVDVSEVHGRRLRLVLTRS